MSKPIAVGTYYKEFISIFMQEHLMPVLIDMLEEKNFTEEQRFRFFFDLYYKILPCKIHDDIPEAEHDTEAAIEESRLKAKYKDSVILSDGDTKSVLSEFVHYIKEGKLDSNFTFTDTNLENGLPKTIDPFTEYDSSIVPIPNNIIKYFLQNIDSKEIVKPLVISLFEQGKTLEFISNTIKELGYHLTVRELKQLSKKHHKSKRIRKFTN